MLERAGTHIFGELIKSPEALARFTRKEWIAMLNKDRDWLKHGGEPTMQIAGSSAAYMIARAASKVENWTPTMVAFKIWLQVNIDRI
jgi:hypothetical protein